MAKPLGKSFVNVYADEEKVDRVEVEVQLARTWQRKEEVEGLEEVSIAGGTLCPDLPGMKEKLTFLVYCFSLVTAIISSFEIPPE